MNEVILNLYNNGLSIRKIAIRLSKRTRTIRLSLQNQGIKIRRRINFNFIIYKDKRYSERPDGYFRATRKNAEGKKTFLHRDIFEDFHGRKIMLNCEINHIDHNRKNNDISNLEELQKEDHTKETNDFTRRKQRFV